MNPIEFGHLLVAPSMSVLSRPMECYQITMGLIINDILIEKFR
ncbi:hypothetical protein HAP32_04803 [Serratia fonticola]|nr:hypothetical protein HAP32_04803 [Serratia fonticola]